MVDLTVPQRLLALLETLLILSEDKGMPTRARVGGRQKTMFGTDRPRIERVLDHIHKHYNERLTTEDMAGIAHLSRSGFQRLFQRHIQMGFVDYLAQLRIGQACQLLISTTKPIAHIATDVGYDNLSNFNRQFRALARKLLASPPCAGAVQASKGVDHWPSVV
jgi:transcriptional regulator GlxA family with amidase domain